MILSSCGKCLGGHGRTILDIAQNGKGAAARKTSMSGVRSDVDDRTHVSFPIIASMDDEKFMKDFVFIPVVQSPGIAFISLANEPDKTEVVVTALNKCWPIVVLSVVMAFIFAVFIWIAVSYISIMWVACGLTTVLSSAMKNQWNKEIKSLSDRGRGGGGRGGKLSLVTCLILINSFADSLCR